MSANVKVLLCVNLVIFNQCKTRSVYLQKIIAKSTIASLQATKDFGLGLTILVYSINKRSGYITIMA